MNLKNSLCSACALLFMTSPVWAEEELSPELDAYETQYSQTDIESRPQAFYDPLQELAEEAGTAGRYGQYERVIHAPGIYPEEELGTVWTYIGGVPVISSPFLGERAAFDGSDLTVNLPHPNQDLRLLEQRQRIENVLLEAGIPLPERPVLDISGDIEVFAFVNDPFEGSTTGDLDIGEIELHFGATLNPWVTSMITLQTQTSSPALGGNREDNSNVRVHKAFIVFGNLNRSPFYGTIGQLYVPYGRYKSSLLTTTVVRDMSRTKERTAILGYKQPGAGGLFASVYGFRSSSGVGRSGDGGINVGYLYIDPDDTVRFEVGGGVISNVAEGERYQATGLPDFGGFGSTRASERIQSRPAGVNINSSVDVNEYTLTAEYVVPTARFHASDLSFNGRGARPTAFHIEGVRSFEILEKPANVAFGYSSTREALALDFPRHRISAAFNVSLWRNTIETFEIRYDKNYKGSTTAGGIGPDGEFIMIDTGDALGKSSLTAAVQIGVYF